MRGNKLEFKETDNLRDYESISTGDVVRINDSRNNEKSFVEALCVEAYNSRKQIKLFYVRESSNVIGIIGMSPQDTKLVYLDSKRVLIYDGIKSEIVLYKEGQRGYRGLDRVLNNAGISNES